MRSALSAISSASRLMSRARATGVVRDHDSNAPRAARTAASTSSAPARGIVAHGSAVYGLMLSKMAPERASTHSPPISILYAFTPTTVRTASTTSTMLRITSRVESVSPNSWLAVDGETTPTLRAQELRFAWERFQADDEEASELVREAITD